MDLAEIAIGADPPWNIIVRFGGRLPADPIACDFDTSEAIGYADRAPCIAPNIPIRHV